VGDFWCGVFALCFVLLGFGGFAAVPEDKDKKEEKGFLATFTSDWKYYAPVGILVAIPALANEVIVLSEEAQLLAVFMLFTGTIYTQAGGMISSSLDEYRENILK
jgi:hypothetical protein